jgi:amino acid adenylation domain-containing protein
MSSSLSELLRWRAQHQSEQPAYTFLRDGEHEEASLTYGALDRRARAIAAVLQRRLPPGERALLLYPPGLDYIAAFFGCLYAGVIAVPVYPPSQRRLDRVLSIWSDAQPQALLTTAKTWAQLERWTANTSLLEGLTWFTTDTLPDAEAGQWREFQAHSETVAFLQYTSGSTAAPKGVIVSHGNLLHNERLIQESFQVSADDVILGWLPLYHDMGLIGNVLQALYLGAPCILMSPLDFLRRPVSWLQAISRYRATTSGGPNFAYNLCAQRVTPEQREGLDLSSWRRAFNGAEPLRAETLEAFSDIFAPCGFRREAFFPCYGLAEATLFVSGGGRSFTESSRRFEASALEQGQAVEVSGSIEGRVLVGSGQVAAGQTVAIVHPETLTRCGPQQVGEIWVSSPSVAQGYWQKPEVSAQVFQARIAGTDEGPFLRTGDLGFLRDGELFVTGRLKDLIIIRGRNHYPQDLELTVQKSHPALRPGCGAAFSVPVEGEERLVIAQEVDGPPGEVDVEGIASAVRRAVAEEHELQVHAVALLQAGGIPKTSSGKLQRRACRSAFLKGNLTLVGCSLLPQAREETPAPAPLAPEALLATEPTQRQAWLQDTLRQHAATLLRLAPGQVPLHSPLSTLGLDSLKAVELTHQLETALGISLSAVELLQGISLAELAGELLGQLQSSKAPEASAVPLAPGDVFPLSHGQQGLWFLQQLDARSTAYTIARAVRIRSPLSVPALRRAFQLLVDRHPALRTSFTSHHGVPQQQVAPHREVSFEQVEASTWSEPELEHFLDEAAHRPFDLEHDALLRVTLLRRSSQEHVLLLAVHHLITDFWTLSLWAHELGVLYHAEASHTPAVLPPLRAHYAEYVAWQARKLEGPEGAALRAWWQQRLAQATPSLELPTTSSRSLSQPARGHSQRLRLGAELTRALQELGRAHDATLYMTLLAAFQTLLHRYSGQESLTVGTPTAGRTQAAWRQVAGYFVNPLVLHADFSRQPTFLELLAQVRHTVLEALAHQELPYSLLVEQHASTRGASASSLFQVLFVMQGDSSMGPEGLAAFSLGEEGARLRLGGLELESMRLRSRAPQYDLTLMVAPAGGELLASLEYDTRLFEDDTIRWMLGTLEHLLHAIAASPTQRLADLPLLTDAGQRQLLVDWNDTTRELPPTQLVHALFEQQVQRAPEAVALLTEEHSLSYAELNRRANQLAHRLRRKGVQAGARVGLCLERSADMVIGLLAVLKAGAAYVPLDPHYPAERLRFILQEAAAPVVLTLEHLRDRLPAGLPGILCLDSEAAEIAREPEENPAVDLSPEALAYVIFTSGSTGRPKGVMVQHRSVANLLMGCQECFGIPAGTRVFQFTTLNFDVFVAELCCSLLTGATWVLTGKAGLLFGEELVSLLRRGAVQALFAPPSAIASLVGAELPALTHIISAGEACPPALARQLGQGRRFFNAYGPTETTVYCTVAEYSPEREGLPIGRPMANVRTYVLDGQLRPVPPGVPGELFIGGAGVAPGYLNRADLTTERFIPSPFASRPGERLYRTGDRVRYGPDGQIEFLGRLDHQVKIRGLRIELGEVDALLREHPEVREAVSLARPGPAGDMRLVSYVVPRTASDTLPSRLHAHLREYLPVYMQPAAIVALDALPLLPNGKVDRRALPEPAWQRMAPAPGYVPPRGPVEETLAAIWSQVLGVSEVGAHDHFFELGGHSLLAIQVVARVREALQVELSLRELFDLPTLSALGELVARRRQGARALALPPLSRVPRHSSLPLSPAQWRLWFLARLSPDSRAHSMFQALRLTGVLDVRALERSLDEVIRRHEVLRTTFPTVDGQPVQAIAPHAPFTLPVEDLSHLPRPLAEERMLELAHQEARRGFDLSNGPLLALTLVRLEQAGHVLLVRMHHIIGDDWSTGVLARELSQLYEAFRAGKPSPLPELEFQYVDVAHWQRQWLTDEVLAPELAFWKEHLGANPPVLELPTDFPRPTVQSFHGASHGFTLSRSLRTRLEALALREGCSLFIPLLAAFAVTLQRYAAQSDFVVGIPVAHRTRSEWEGLIGLFVNVLPVRLQLEGSASYQELLARVRRTALEAYDHQDVPFERLLEALKLRRDPSRPALRQVAFSFQNAARQTLRLPDLEAHRVEVDPGVARLDLTLFLWEEADGLAGRFEYNTSLFEPATAAALSDYLEQVLEDMAAHPEQPSLALPEPLAARRERWLQRQETPTPAAEAPGLDTLLERSNLTEHQLTFWFAQKLQPDIELYSESAAATFSLTGEVDPCHFQQAWQALVDRSDSLRSTLHEVDGMPQRRVHPWLRAPVRVEDLSEDPPGALQDWLRAMHQQRLRPGVRLFECALVKAGPQRWVWFLKLHHIIADGRSLGLLFQHVADFYQRSQEGRLQEAPALPPYQEYVEHARQSRHSEAYARAEAYWKEKLAQPAALPSFYRTDSTVSTTRTQRYSHTLDAALSDQVRRKSSELGLMSPSLLFLTALLAHVHRITGESLLRVGTPLHSRAGRFQSTLGLFMTALPLQVRLTQEESFASLAQQLQVELLQAARHHLYPVRHKPEAKAYDVYFNFQNVGFGTFHGMPVHFELGHSGHANESLTLQVRDFNTTGRYTLDFDLRCDAFGPEQAERSVRHYLNLLEALLTDARQPLQEAPMLSEEELHTLLVKWNRTERPYPLDRCLHALIEDQVERTPEATALVYEGTRCTYRELEQRANQLAHRLQRLGVGPDVRVAVHLHRSQELVVALLGILKAGGAYVPLDPDYPQERLAFMLADSGARVLLTQHSLREALAGGSAQVLCLDEEREALEKEPAGRPPCAATPHTLAYVLYTSGSTGRPKGVAIEHQGICNRLLWMQEAYGLGPEDRVLQKTPFSFDVSVWEFFWPLMTGATLVVARPGGHQDSRYLVECIRRNAITTLHFVPSMLQVFLEDPKVETCRGLVRVFCSGEALPSELVKRFHSRLDAALHNLYGPTEASVDVTYHACERGGVPPRIPIGRPIANTRIHLLDRHLKPVPVGVPGELHIGGIGLARCYLNRPELTAGKFIRDPFSPHPGARLYKTGDLARYREDGEIEFLGRMDDQVKLRGFRIELGEIESALAAHPDVREATVALREDRPGDPRLVAYVVPVAGHTPSASELRGFVGNTLPAHMVPAALVLLERMPLTPSGKVDRKLLPAPGGQGEAREAAYAPPRSEAEQVMASLWAEVLGLERAGVHDDFFALGGNSLLATRLLNLVEHTFLVEVPLRALFEQPTVARLLAWMAQALEQQEEAQKQLARELLREVEQLAEHEVEALLEVM